jgi:hypothetical protein
MIIYVSFGPTLLHPQLMIYTEVGVLLVGGRAFIVFLIYLYVYNCFIGINEYASLSIWYFFIKTKGLGLSAAKAEKKFTPAHNLDDLR